MVLKEEEEEEEEEDDERDDDDKEEEEDDDEDEEKEDGKVMEASTGKTHVCWGQLERREIAVEALEQALSHFKGLLATFTSPLSSSTTNCFPKSSTSLYATVLVVEPVGWRGCGMEGLWDGGVVGWRGCGMESKSLLSSAANACFCYGLLLNLQFGRKL